MMDKKFIKKQDIILIGILFLIGAAFLICQNWNTKDVTAYIYSDSILAYEINLSKNTEKKVYTFDNKSCKITADKNEIYFSESDCHDKTCIKSGHLSKSGEFAACLPNNVILVLKSGNNSQVDAIT